MSSSNAESTKSHQTPTSTGISKDTKEALERRVKYVMWKCNVEERPMWDEEQDAEIASMKQCISKDDYPPKAPERTHVIHPVAFGVIHRWLHGDAASCLELHIPSYPALLSKIPQHIYAKLHSQDENRIIACKVRPTDPYDAAAFLSLCLARQMIDKLPPGSCRRGNLIRDDLLSSMSTELRPLDQSKARLAYLESLIRELDSEYTFFISIRIAAKSKVTRHKDKEPYAWLREIVCTLLEGKPKHKVLVFSHGSAEESSYKERQDKKDEGPSRTGWLFFNKWTDKSLSNFRLYPLRDLDKPGTGPPEPLTLKYEDKMTKSELDELIRKGFINPHGAGNRVGILTAPSSNPPLKR
ncbi:hypothetical protein HD806DRAFT_519567 [Xylariaceae sp. AK1471]|nr:hypothetical protein HD806DRAFT_519567 [Xylariaceae sp. AK1471]